MQASLTNDADDWQDKRKGGAVGWTKIVGAKQGRHVTLVQKNGAVPLNEFRGSEINPDIVGWLYL